MHGHVVPNDFFKRPGPHHAFEVDLELLAGLRAALDPLEQLGYPDPLAGVLGCSPKRVLEPGGLYGIEYRCVLGDDFGLSTYGPMLDRAGLATTFGGLLFPQRDATRDPISPFWLENHPWLPHQIAPAAVILEAIPGLLDPPERAWVTLFDEMIDPDPEPGHETPEHERPDRLIARWRTEYRAEVEAFAARLREIAARGGSVTTWFSEQGWL